MSAPSASAEESETAKAGGDRYGISNVEKGIAVAGFLVVLALRCRYIYAARFDTDESQHLHVVWGWATGLLPYRDFFDNHAPLFHILCAPLLRLFGERADILLLMRWCMVPLWLGSLVLIYAIGAKAFSPRAGLWAALLSATSARFFFKMGEFRTDVLWTFLWFSALAVFIQMRLSARQFFFAGLILGTGLAVSMKTSMMLMDLAVSGIVLLLLGIFLRKRPLSVMLLARCLGAWIVGFVVLPAAVMGYFAHQGALDLMRKYIIDHNRLPGMSLLDRAGQYGLQIALVSCTAVAVAAACAKRSAAPSLGFRRAAVILFTASFYILVRFIWPIVTAQDYAPLDPLFYICLGGLLVFGWRWLAGRAASLAPMVLAVFAAGNLALIFWTENPLRTGTAPEIAMVADVLKLTTPGQVIMDAKGETIFRRRAYFYVLETLTLKRFELGLLQDDIVACMTKARVPIVHGALRMPETAAAWERAHYVPIGPLDALGLRLPRFETGSISFSIDIPERYAILSDHGEVQGLLDGERVSGPRELSVGSHDFKPDALQPGERFAVLWARAAEKGYSPFPKRPVP